MIALLFISIGIFHSNYKRKQIIYFVHYLITGKLNTIAPIISNFFMASFFLVNIACFHASFVGSPSFRPSFKYYNKWVSLLTGLFCISIMFYLEYITAVITVVIMGIILLYIAKKGPGFQSFTVKPVYLKHVDNWFLKLVLYYFNKYIFKNHLSTCSR